MPLKHWRCLRQVWILVVLAVGVSPKSSNVVRWLPDRNHKRSSHRSWIPFRREKLQLGRCLKNKVGTIIYVGSWKKCQIVFARITRKIPTSLCNNSLEKILMSYKCQMRNCSILFLSHANDQPSRRVVTCISWLQPIQTNKDVSALNRLTPKKISQQKGLNSTLKF